MKLAQISVKISTILFKYFRYLSRLRRILDEIAIPIQISSVIENISPITFPSLQDKETTTLRLLHITALEAQKKQ